MDTATNDPELRRVVDGYLNAQVLALRALQRDGSADGLTAEITLTFAAEALRAKWAATPGAAWREDILTFSSVDQLLSELDARAKDMAVLLDAGQAFTWPGDSTDAR